MIPTPPRILSWWWGFWYSLRRQFSARLAANNLNTCREVATLKSSAGSKCTTLVEAQVDRQACIFLGSSMSSHYNVSLILYYCVVKRFGKIHPFTETVIESQVSDSVHSYLASVERSGVILYFLSTLTDPVLSPRIG